MKIGTLVKTKTLGIGIVILKEYAEGLCKKYCATKHCQHDDEASIFWFGEYRHSLTCFKPSATFWKIDKYEE